MYQNNLFFKINVHHRHDGHHQYNDGKYAKCWICILNLFESPVANSLTLFEYNCAYQHVHCIGKKRKSRYHSKGERRKVMVQRCKIGQKWMSYYTQFVMERNYWFPYLQLENYFNASDAYMVTN